MLFKCFIDLVFFLFETILLTLKHLLIIVYDILLVLFISFHYKYFSSGSVSVISLFFSKQNTFFFLRGVGAGGRGARGQGRGVRGFLRGLVCRLPPMSGRGLTRPVALFLLR